MYRYVTGMLILVCTRMLLVCTRMYLYVTRMLLVCYSYVLVCYLYVLVCYSYVIRMHSYVPMWCFSHNSLVALVLPYFLAAQQILAPEDNDATSDPDDSGDDAQSDSSEMGDFIEHSYEVLFVPDPDVECVTVRSQ